MSRFLTDTLDGIEITRAKDIEKHGDHDQSSHGNRDGAGGITEETAGKIQQFTRDWGGLSIKMTDGSMPDKGFMVSKPTSLSRVVPAKDFYDPKEGWKILRDYEKTHAKDLATGRNYLGTWENEGKVFLDVSENIMAQDEATSLGASRDQLKIWDVVNQKEIDTGGTGGVQKRSKDGSNKRYLVDDRRGERRIRKATLGEIDGYEGRRTKVIYFDYGLKPVFKHEGHEDQSSHGNWATGRSEEDIKRISEFKNRGPSTQDLDEALEGSSGEIDRDKAEMMIDNDSFLNSQIEDNIEATFDARDISDDERLELYDEVRNDAVQELIDTEPDYLENFARENGYDSLQDPSVIDGLRESLNDVYGVETTATFRDGDRQGETVTLTSSVDEVTSQGDMLKVVVNVRDENGNPVNKDEIVRYLEKNEETGTWSVEHNLLQIDKEFRGLGFGSKFLQQSEDYYVAKGFTHITLNAGLKDGARHWANSGFDWNRDELPNIVQNLDSALRSRQSDIDFDLTEFTEESKARYSEDLQKGREILGRMTDGNGNIRDMREDNFPTPKEFASLGADRPLQTTDGKSTWSGKELLRGEYIPYMKILTAEGQNILSGPIDMDGDGLVYDGTPREKPVSGVGKK